MYSDIKRFCLDFYGKWEVLNMYKAEWIPAPESTVWAPQQVSGLSAHQPSSSWSPLAMPHSKPSATNRNFRRAKSSVLFLSLNHGSQPQPDDTPSRATHQHHHARVLALAIQCFATLFNDNAAVARPARGNSRQRRGHLVRSFFFFFLRAARPDQSMPIAEHTADQPTQRRNA
jgi:hypothetical protein